MIAEQTVCKICNKKYMVNHQSPECPHERLIDMDNKVNELVEKCLLTESEIGSELKLHNMSSLFSYRFAFRLGYEFAIPIIKEAVAEPLFNLGEVKLHSGGTSDWKINCDALTDAAWECIAYLISTKHKFGRVIGIPKGGLKLAKALTKYLADGAPTMIVDDVLTTGNSFEEIRESKESFGVVLFARGNCPNWVYPVFQLWEARDKELAEMTNEKVRETVADEGYIRDTILAINSYASYNELGFPELYTTPAEGYDEEGMEEALGIVYQICALFTAKEKAVAEEIKKELIECCTWKHIEELINDLETKY